MLITKMEYVEGYERIEKVEMEVGCEAHKEVRWRCEFLVKTYVDYWNISAFGEREGFREQCV